MILKSNFHQHRNIAAPERFSDRRLQKAFEPASVQKLRCGMAFSFFRKNQQL